MAFLVELATRYGASLRAALPLLLAAICGAILFALPAVRGAAARKMRGRHRLVALALVLAALAWAWRLRWLCDDAFISFRYARNLVTGQGLVFNVGERVEGYTNFLWTVLLAGGARLGADIPLLSLVLSLASLVGVLALTTLLARRAMPDSTLPLATVLLAGSYAVASYGTSGLETMFVTLLGLLALERALAGAPLAAGLAGIAAVLTRPDQALAYLALGVALASAPDRWRTLPRYITPFVLVYLPYFFLRWSYYGDLLPNTFYAKSADTSYIGQGLIYLAVSATSAGLWGAAPLAVFGALFARRTLLARYAVLAIALHLAYVTKIGGDFMLGRFLVPILPLFFLLIEIGLSSLLERGSRWVLPAALALAPAMIPIRLLPPRQETWHIVDERTSYPITSLRPLAIDSLFFRRAALVRKHISERGLHPILASGNPGMLGYFTGLPIVDVLGLTDRTVAHRPLADHQRGTPGHEKSAPLEYLVSRGVVLADGPLYHRRYADVTLLRIEDEAFFLLRYDAALMNALRGQPNVRFVDFPQFLDGYLAHRQQGGQEKIRRDLPFFDAYYFSHTADPTRRDRLAALLTP